MNKIANIDKQLTGTACIITGGLLNTHHTKTTHGLLRESRRFDIVGVVDEKCADHDAGDFLDGKLTGIKVFATVDDLIKHNGEKPTFAIVGMATKGGILPEDLYPVLLEVLHAGINVVNGLHQPISEIPEFKKAAEERDVFIYDIRKSKPFEQLHFWNGKIREVTSLKIGVLGTDCSIGKRTTAKLLANALNEAGVKAEMIFTGQTGWLQGVKYGFIFDATPNDFIPGEIEHAVYECWKNEQPDVILIEGQASLLNPSGPCGSEFIISARLDGVILQHHPIRSKYSNLEKLPDVIPGPLVDMEIIRLMGSETWALTQNTAGMTGEASEESAKLLHGSTGLPVISPLYEGVGGLVDIIKSKLYSTVKIGGSV
jgi:uncharacterized NAD-dependent epimerase/dehydratase family protein